MRKFSNALKMVAVFCSIPHHSNPFSHLLIWTTWAENPFLIVTCLNHLLREISIELSNVLRYAFLENFNSR